VIRSVSVVVPAHDEQDLLPACLASLRRAARVLRGCEVHLVVVADKCRDRTAQVARGGGAAVVTIDAQRAGAARAAGVREVLRRTSPLDPAEVWVATTDADTIVPPGWLCEQVRYANRGWDAVAGTIRVADWSGRHPGARSLFRRRYGRGTGPHSHVHGANLGFRASAYRRAGGVPAVPTGEDRALVAALDAAGSRVLRTRALAVVTSARREARAPHGFGDYLAGLDAEAEADSA
jgi:glycosyltransferase involved in cell wall biosynthesis